MSLAHMMFPKTGYAWLITIDHLEEPDGDSEQGTCGPSTATDADLERLHTGEGDQFKMYDGDGILYYTGRAVISEGAEWDEQACGGPLDDFGTPNAGCAEIRWPQHPERNIG